MVKKTSAKKSEKTREPLAFNKMALAFVIVVLFFFIAGTFFEAPFKTRVETKTVTQTITNCTNQCSAPDFSTKNITVTGIAVYENSDTGGLIPIHISFQPGTGLVYLDVATNYVEKDLQVALMTAWDYAQHYAGKSLADSDTLIQIESGATTISGGSGSAAISTGIIALLENKTLRKDAVITGTVLPDGSIGSVEKLQAKVKVAEQKGLSLLIIPQQECANVNVTASLNISCVSNIRQAMGYLVEE